MTTTDEQQSDSASSTSYDPLAPHPGMSSPSEKTREDDRERAHNAFVLRYGSLELDVPRSLGYFGGLSLAVALEVIDPPLALFIAAVPFVKMLDLPRMLTPVRFVSHVVQGAAKPVGSDADGVVRVSGDDE